MRGLLAAGLQRRLVARTVLLSVAALVALAVASALVANDILVSRFQDEARAVARNADTDLQNTVDVTTRTAATVAGLPGLRVLIQQHDGGAGFTAYLTPLKSRLGVAFLEVADLDGRIVGAAEDFTPGDTLPPELARRAGIRAEEAWIVRDEAAGLTVRAIAIVRDVDGQPLGLVQTGSVLDAAFLRSVKRTSDTDLALVVSGAVRASTLASAPPVRGFPAPEDVAATVPGSIGQELTVSGARVYATFTLVNTHTTTPTLLAVFVSEAALAATQLRLLEALLVAVVLLAASLALLVYRVARTVTRPIAELAAATSRIGRGDAGVGLSIDGPDEIGALQRGFRSMVEALAQREAELRSAATELDRANRLKSEFLTNVSHELRTPLNAVIGYSQLLIDGMDGELEDTQLADVRRIAAAAEHLLGLINGLLDLAKIEAGKLEVDARPLDLAKLVREVFDLVRPQAESKHLHVAALLPDEVPTVLADRARVKQILVNLVANAVKFTQQGAITISVANGIEDVTVTVADTGIGIAPEAQAFVFDEFRQENASTSRRYGGTGLGLAIAKRLVELQGGRIWVESAQGLGSKFHFTIPRYEGEPATLARSAASSR